MTDFGNGMVLDETRKAKQVVAHSGEVLGRIVPIIKDGNASGQDWVIEYASDESEALFKKLSTQSGGINSFATITELG